MSMIPAFGELGYSGSEFLHCCRGWFQHEQHSQFSETSMC